MVNLQDKFSNYMECRYLYMEDIVKGYYYTLQARVIQHT
jgi:hypothetical protein